MWNQPVLPEFHLPSCILAEMEIFICLENRKSEFGQILDPLGTKDHKHLWKI